MKGNNVEMTFMTSDLENGFPRWYLMFCDYATIIEPDTGAADKIHMRKLVVNGQPTLRIFIYPVSRSRHQNDGPTPMQKYPVGISFDLVQIP